MENKIEVNGKTYVLESSINNKEKPKSLKGMECCIIRTYSAGVFVGYINRKLKGKEQTIFQARRLWRWSGALDCSDIAEKGVDGESCKFSCIRAEIDLKEIIEIQPITKKAKETIDKVEDWEND